MSLEWMDGFDHYGISPNNGRDNMLAGPYAEVLGGSDPAFISTINVRTGSNSLGMDLSISPARTYWRRVLGAARSGVGFAQGFYVPLLPSVNDVVSLISFRTAANENQVTLLLQSTGILTVRQTNAAGTILGQSDVPVIFAGAYQYVAMFVNCHGSTGSVEVRVDGVTVISESGINTDPRSTGEISQLAGEKYSGGGADSAYVDDFWCWNDLGAENNDFPGNVRVRARFPTQDTAVTDWVRNTGSTDFSAINQAAPDGDTTYIEAVNANDISEFDFEDVPSEVSAILAAQTVVMMKKTDAGESNVQVSLVSGVNEANGADRPITTAYTYWQDIFEVDPDTGAAWTKSAIDAAKLKLERTV